MVASTNYRDCPEATPAADHSGRSRGGSVFRAEIRLLTSAATILEHRLEIHLSDSIAHLLGNNFRANSPCHDPLGVTPDRRIIVGRRGKPARDGGWTD